MAEHFGFLKSIIDNHDDDAPRLIYADWLEEQGQDLRAQFIRAQCLLTRCCRHEDDDEQAMLPAEQILPEYREVLLAPFFERGFLECAHRYACGEISGFLFSFRRGFVEGLEVCGAPATEFFVDQADELFRLTPLQVLRFIPYDVYGGYYESNAAASQATLERIARLPYLSRLHEVDFTSYPHGPAFDLIEQALGMSLPAPAEQEEDMPPPDDEYDIPF